MSIKRAATNLKIPFVCMLAACTLIACSDTTVATRSFNDSHTFDIPGIAVSLPFEITLDQIPLEINLTDQPGYNDNDLDFVTSVQVRELEFEITPESNDPANDQLEDGNLDSFEFVSNLGISLRAGVDGVETVVDVATLPANDPQIASNTTTLTMNVMDTDIRDLIEGDNPELLISITGTPPPDVVQVRANIRFRVGLGFR